MLFKKKAEQKLTIAEFKRPKKYPIINVVLTVLVLLSDNIFALVTFLGLFVIFLKVGRIW